MTKILGINERRYPMSNDPTYCIAVTAVLVEGEIGDYAAYVGARSKEHAEWIAQYGNKLSFEEACIHFPGGQLKREKYRE